MVMCLTHDYFDGKYDWIDQAGMFYTQKWSLRSNLAPQKKKRKRFKNESDTMGQTSGGVQFFPFWLLMISIFVEYFGQFCWIFIFYQKKKIVEPLYQLVLLFSFNFYVYSWIFFQGNAAFKGRQWNKAVKYYTEAIKLNMMNATYYCNRAAAYLELGWYECSPVCQLIFLLAFPSMHLSISIMQLPASWRGLQ